MALTSTSGLVRSPTTGSALRFSIKVTPLRRRTNPTTRCPRRVSALTRARPRGLAAPVTNARIIPPAYGRDAVERCASRHVEDFFVAARTLVRLGSPGYLDAPEALARDDLTARVRQTELRRNDEARREIGRASCRERVQL